MYLTNLLAFLLVLLYSGTQVNGAETTFVPTTGTAFAIGSDASIAATIDVEVSHTITVTYDLAPPVSIGSIAVVHDETNAADKITVTATTGLADRYTITKTSDTVVTVVIKEIVATDEAIVLQFNSGGADTLDGSTTIDTKTGFSPASQYVAFGDDLTVVATIPVDATQTFTVTYVLGSPVTLGTITVDHDATTEAAKLVVAAESGLASKYSIAETTDTTVTIMIKTIATSDDGIVINFDSAGTNQDVEYTVNAKTSFSPASLTTGTVGSDFALVATVSVIASHTITASYFNGNMKTVIGTITIDHDAAAADKIVVASDTELVAADYTFAETTDTTVTLTLKTFAEADINTVFLFDSTVNNQDALFVFGGASSLTCGFSILLAIAVALREFMSA